MHKYRLISKKGEGTFSEVLKAQSIKSGKHVAIKCMKNHFDSVDQVNNLREIQALRRLAGHPNIIKLHEVLYDEPTGRMALVFELMDMNLYEAVKGRRHYLPEDKVKRYMYELLKALDHMHRNGIFHRDVKPENVLLMDDEIKLADLGSCRGIYSRQPYTEYISTRWYRAPECLLTDGYYNFKMDLFAVGCVWFEVVALFPLFPGQNEMDQIQKIHNILGTPPAELVARKFKRNASHMDFNFPEKKGTGIERLVPHAAPELVELMKKLLRYDPDDRILSRQALKDPYFRDLRHAEKERGAAPALGDQPAAAAASGTQRSSMRSSHRDNMPTGMSASSSTNSIGPSSDIQEVNTNASSRSQSPEERSGALPSIGKVMQRKGVPLPAPSAATSDGGASGREDQGDDPDDGALLPPIGGMKDKARHGKHKAQSSFKAAGAATLQKHAISNYSKGSSKGFSGSLGVTGGMSTGMSAKSAMSSSHSQKWGGGGGKDPELTGVSDRSAPNHAVVEKMNSTWAPNQQHSRKFVSPFSHKLARDAATKHR
jgi:renal tumor antigen